MTRRSETEILETVYRRSSQLRLRFRMLRALVGVVALALLLTATPSLIRQLGAVQVNTADQPGTEEASQDDTEEGALESTEGIPAGSGGPAPAGPSAGKQGSSRAQGSRSTEGLPAGTISPSFQIAFSRCCPTSGADIYLMNTDGSGLRELRRAGAEPEWSPDGKVIAFTDHHISGGDIQLIHATGSGYQKLPARGTSPTWSPDGDRLAFNLECGDQFGTPCYPQESGFQKDCGPECGIGVVNRDGSGIRRLGDGIWPDWGPDGRIIFTDGVPDESCYYRPGYTAVGTACELPIWVMNSDGSSRGRLPIDKAISPTWSHDGRRIAFHTASGGVFIANSDGSGIRRVAPSGGYWSQPSWSPDDLWLAMTAGTPGDFSSIYLKKIDGSAESV